MKTMSKHFEEACRKYSEKSAITFFRNGVAETDITYGDVDRDVCRVAHWIMGNGATISKKHINFLGNRSLKGLEESCGLMVNYVYSQAGSNEFESLFSLF